MIDTMQLLKQRQARLQSMTPEERRQMAEEARAEEQAERERRRMALFGRVPAGPANDRGQKMPTPPPVAKRPKPDRKESGVAAIMRAARSFAGPFTKQQLVVAAYRMAPHLFGLRGFQEFPDSNTVLAYLYGKEGLVSRGLIERVGSGLFRVRGEANGSLIGRS